MYDKYGQWTYSGGEPERSLTKDEMLDNITLYWLTTSAISFAQLYWENNTNNFNAMEQKTAYIKIPIAVTILPGEIYQAPRSGTERTYNKLVYFNEVNKAATSRRGKSRNSSPPRSVRRSGDCVNRVQGP